MQHPTYLYGSLARRPSARSGFVDVRMVDILELRMVVEALLSGEGGTGLSQKHCCYR